MTQSEWNAAGRHALTAIASGVTVLSAVHVFSSADAKNVLDGANEVWDGLSKIALGLGPLVALVSGWFASRSASPKAQIQAVNAADNGVKVVPANAPVAPVNAPLK
jgi:hypothetical protein